MPIKNQISAPPVASKAAGLITEKKLQKANIDSLVKSRKTTFLRECLVFGV
ncbi:hypothetical protein D1AOALGA4SA_362 [Olavius algarvensis Delta 1 endosymbiont]|nr:hypothetical protein D1AOALGA4SA_362 [Olavius algarvensis Delta 1 endosymbiont]